MKNLTSSEQVAVLDIIHALRADNSKLYKEAILRENAEFGFWKDYLVDVYNPFVTYGISGDKDGDQDDLDNLRLCRNLNAGVSAVTINKIYKNLIPTASKMMKAYDYGKKPKDSKGPWWVGKKYDGNYVNIVVSSEGIKFYTSGGHEYTHPEAAELFDGKLPPGNVFMAERCAGKGKLGARRKCNLEGPKGKQYAKPDNVYMIFDCVMIEDFEYNSSDTWEYGERRTMIPYEWRAEEEYFEDWCDVETYLDDFVAEGGEGIVIKQADMIWRNSTSRRVDFMKWKKRQTADLLCIEEIEGEGNAKGYLGSVKLRDSVGRTVNVGSGLSRDICFPCGDYLGKVIEIEYEHIADTYVQPAVVAIRDDKSASDID